jgi:protein arginine N-methyltransferase 1
MYSLHDYTWMITDAERMGPYVRALEAVVKPGSVVVDIGTGTGIFALVACRLGARRVFAIDINDAIEVGRELAEENGVADHIVFFQKDAREVDLPEPADVIVSDLRGTLPLNGEHIAIIADARARFLKPGGALVPAIDRLMVAVVEKAELYDWTLGPAVGPLGVTLEAVRARLRQGVVVDRRGAALLPQDLLTSPKAWATLDYASVRPGPISGHVDLRIERPGTAHGLAIWFETTLVEGSGAEYEYTMAPGHELCYGRFFLPWPAPVPVSAGDAVSLAIWAQTSGDPWGWNSSVRAANGTVRASFKQSNFIGFTGKPRPRSGDRPGRAISQTMC